MQVMHNIYYFEKHQKTRINLFTYLTHLYPYLNVNKCRPGGVNCNPHVRAQVILTTITPDKPTTASAQLARDGGTCSLAPGSNPRPSPSSLPLTKTLTPDKFSTPTCSYVC